MAAYTPRRSSGPVLRSLSPSGRFHSHHSSQSSSHAPSFRSSTFASSTSSTFSRATPSSFHRPGPDRLSLSGYTTPSVRFPLDRPVSPNRSISVSSRVQLPEKPQKRTCMCSPTNHPGSFRCSLHKGLAGGNSSSQMASYGSSTRLNMRRSAMTNSLVRIGTVEGELVKRALAALIRPSSHSQRRRDDFRPRPSRLCVMSTA